MKVIIAEKAQRGAGHSVRSGRTPTERGVSNGGRICRGMGIRASGRSCHARKLRSSGFRREHLPILPQEFRLVPRQVREGKAYKDDPGVVRQLGVIRNLFDRCESIIVATDAGREES